MALTKIDDRGLNTPVDLLDNEKIRFGTGNDLEIYHDGSHSFIADEGTGQLTIKSNGAGIELQKGDTEFMGRFITDGAVELYYDNVKKFGTRSNGVDIIGNTYIADNDKISFGGSSDLLIYHDGTNSVLRNTGGTLYLQSQSHIELTHRHADNSEEKALFSNVNGAVEIYHNGTKKFETTSDGVQITGHSYQGDDNKAYFGNAQDLQIYHDGTDSYIYSDNKILRIQGNGSAIKINPVNAENCANFNANGSVDLYYDNAKKLETTSTGIQVSGHVDLPDSATGIGKLKLGDDDDLQIYHDGSNSRIHDNGTGILAISGSQIDLQNAAQSETLLQAYQNGAVKLRYDNSVKLETTSAGATLSGNQTITQSGGTTAFLQLNNGTDTDGAKFIYSSSSNAASIQVAESGSGFKIACGGTDAGNRRFQAYSDTTGTVLPYGDENMGKFNPNGSVDLYYDNVKKFETTSDGAKVSGKLVASADGAGSSYTDPVAFLAYSSNSNDDHTAEIFQGRYNRRALTVSHSNTGSVTHVVFEQNDSNVGSITGDGSNVAFNTSSDYRLKENEVLISDGITRLKTLKPYRFNFKTTPSKTIDGFFAHEVSSVIPEAVTGEKDGTEMQQLDYSKLTTLTIAALQEALAKIETLETKVAALEGG